MITNEMISTRALVESRRALIFNISQDQLLADCYLPILKSGFRLASNRAAIALGDANRIKIDLPFHLKVGRSLTLVSEEFFVLNSSTFGFISLLDSAFNIPLKYVFNQILTPGFTGRLYLSLQSDIDISIHLQPTTFLKVCLIQFDKNAPFSADEIQELKVKAERQYKQDITRLSD